MQAPDFGDIGEENAVLVTNSVERIEDHNGQSFINQYVILKDIGEGAHGSVKLCVNSANNELRAVKVINRSAIKKRNRLMKGNDYDVLREVAIMKKLSHPNIVTLFEVMDDPSQDELYMVFEYVEGGPVMSGNVENEPFPEDLARRYFRDVILALFYIHQHNVIHRDLKPENLLLTKDDHLKISDFGVSIVCADDEGTGPVLKDTVGSPAFFSPEMLTGRSYAGKPIDIWAAGITLYNFIYGRCPFMADTTVKIFELIRNASLVFPFATSSLLEDLITRMLDKDPQTRITIDEILAHPWVTKNGTQPLIIADAQAPVPATVSDEEIRKAMDKFLVVGKSLRNKMTRIQSEAASSTGGDPTHNTQLNASTSHSSGGGHSFHSAANTPSRGLSQVQSQGSSTGTGSQPLLSMFDDLHRKLTVMQTTMASRDAKFQDLETRLSVCESELTNRNQRFEQLKQRLKELTASSQQTRSGSTRRNASSTSPAASAPSRPPNEQLAFAHSAPRK